MGYAVLAEALPGTVRKVHDGPMRLLSVCITPLGAAGYVDGFNTGDTSGARLFRIGSASNTSTQALFKGWPLSLGLWVNPVGAVVQVIIEYETD